MEKEISTNLTFSDLKLIATLIEACCQRGTWRANELATVGDLYTKVINSINSIKTENTDTPIA